MGTVERRAREKGEKRKTILRAAIRCFDRKGYDATTLDDVARMAEVAKGTLYLYFKSKADMFASILLEHGFDVFAETLDENLKNCKDFPSAMGGFAKTFEELCLNGKREIFEFFIQLDRGDISRDLSPDLRKEAGRRLEPILAKLSGFLPARRRKREGPRIVIVLWALCIGVAHIARGSAVPGLKSNPREVLSDGMSYILRGLASNN